MYSEIMTANGFQSPWYWLLVAMVWTRMMQRTYGVSHEIMRRAMKGNDEAKQDALVLLDIHIRIVNSEISKVGTFLVLFTSFVLASFGTMGFWNGISMFQAIFLLMLPMNIIGFLGARKVQEFSKNEIEWNAFCKVYKKQRFFKGSMAFFFVIITILWAIFVEIKPYLYLL